LRNKKGFLPVDVILYSMKKLCGIDEAGRGALAGPMVVAGIAVDSDEKLRMMGVRDSKKLPPHKRKNLEPKLRMLGDTLILKVDSREIDQLRKYKLSNHKNLNLNQIEAMLFADIIQRLKAQFYFLDCVGVSPEKFLGEIGLSLNGSSQPKNIPHPKNISKELSSNLSLNFKVEKSVKEEDVKIESIKMEDIKVGSIKMESGWKEDGAAFAKSKILDKHLFTSWNADQLYPVVSAASILAKVERDRLLREEVRSIEETLGECFGSGYPSDRITLNFLSLWKAKYGKLPDCLRFSWATLRKFDQTRLF
jgi:ribonuclease HII